MQLTSGGHLQPLWIGADGIGNIPPLNGIPLGINPDSHYKTEQITLSPGESMLLFTDGLIEAENEEQEIFGKDRLIQYIEGRKETRLGEGLLDAIRKWRGNAPINDDLTLLEIWREKI